MTTPEPFPILIVDDDADIQSLIEFVLMSAGYNVRTASDGLEALTAVET
jgi:CheY-like chemotaxis protein